ncbi:MAG: hypothetical protein RIC24_12480 [Hyphomicrobiales bacterium]|jgi:hypothetical protein
MSTMPLSRMLLDIFSGILAALMIVTAALLLLLVVVNANRGQGDANGSLIIVAGCFALGSAGFYALKRWAKSTRT